MEDVANQFMEFGLYRERHAMVMEDWRHQVGSAIAHSTAELRAEVVDAGKPACPRAQPRQLQSCTTSPSPSVYSADDADLCGNHGDENLLCLPRAAT